MRLDPEEAAYPWNLGTTLNRLGLNDLALGFIGRAIHLAEQAGDEEWSDSSAYLGMAEIAIDAGAPDTALAALARALELDGESDKAHVERLFRGVRELSDDPSPQVSLTIRLLESLPA